MLYFHLVCMHDELCRHTNPVVTLYCDLHARCCWERVLRYGVTLSVLQLHVGLIPFEMQLQLHQSISLLIHILTRTSSPVGYNILTKSPIAAITRLKKRESVFTAIGSKQHNSIGCTTTTIIINLWVLDILTREKEKRMALREAQHEHHVAREITSSW